MDLPEIVGSYVVSTWTLTLWRLFAAVYLAVVLGFALDGGYSNGVFFTYFTNLSFMLVTIYFWVVAILGFLYLRAKPYAKENLYADADDEEGAGAAEELLPQERQRMQSPWASFTVWVMFEVLVGACLGLDLVYWSVLYDPDDSDSGNWLDIHLHGVQFVLMAIELYLNRLPILLPHMVFLMIYGIAYNCLLMWPYFAATGNWVYDIFDWNDNAGLAVVYYIGTLVLFAITYTAGFYAARFRDRRDEAIIANSRVEVEVAW